VSDKMPLFKKSPSDMTSGSLLPEAQRRVLRRCRMLLVKDLDVVQIVDFLSTEEGLRSDQRDVIFACSTREQRAGVLLDQLELRGERTFALFLEALKTYHKHLYLVIDEMLRTTDDECAVERVAISGTTLRRLLRKSSYYLATSAATSRLPTSNSSHAINGTQPTAVRGSLSADESFDGLPDSR
jgi:hypothetical protein